MRIDATGISRTATEKMLSRQLHGARIGIRVPSEAGSIPAHSERDLRGIGYEAGATGRISET